MMFQAANLTYNKEAGGAGLRKGDNNVKSWRGQRGSSAPSHPMQSLHSKHTNAHAPSKQIVFDWEAWLGPKCGPLSSPFYDYTHMHIHLYADAHTDIHGAIIAVSAQSDSLSYLSVSKPSGYHLCTQPLGSVTNTHMHTRTCKYAHLRASTHTSFSGNEVQLDVINGG